MNELLRGPLWLRLLAILFAVLFIAGTAIWLKAIIEFVGRSPLFS